MLKRRSLLLLPLSFLLLFSCVGPPPVFLRNPQLNEKIKPIHKIAVLPPKVDVYELTAGGVREKIDEWSEKARNNVLEATQNQFANLNIVELQVLNRDSLNSSQKELLTDLQALYEAVDASIIAHIYGRPENRFPEKIKNFDYSLGPNLKPLLNDADAFLFISGVDHIATGGRKALQTGAIVVGALFGVMVIPRGGTTAISAALVDAQSGEILWHKFILVEGVFDLRDTKSTARMMKGVFKYFPIKLK